MALKSNNVTQGVDRAPNRSLFAALGFTKEETDRPLIGIVCSHNEIVPGHMNLDKIAEAVKAGVRMAGVLRLCSRHRRVRRHRHGPHRHEVLPGHPGSDRRLHRVHGHRPPV